MQQPRKPKLQASHANRRAAFTVEVALTIPILFSIFFACVEAARVNMMRNSMSNAVYEGARRAAIPGATAAQAQAAASSMISAVGVNNSVITVTPSNLTTTTDTVTVSVSVPYSQLSWGSTFFFDNKTQFTRSCTLTREKTK